MRPVPIALLVAGLVAGCAPPPPAPPPMPPLAIEKMPEAEPPAPDAASAPPLLARGGACGAAPAGRVGELAPPLSAASLARRPIDLELGKVTVVYFWATWCAPCRKASPELGMLYARQHDRGLELIAVSVDEDAPSVAGFVRMTGATYPVVWDQDLQIAQCWKPTAMPTAYVVDRGGVVRFEHDGYRDGDAVILEREVESLLVSSVEGRSPLSE